MCPMAPPGEGLFKERDGQQSLAPCSHQEMRREKWGRTFSVSSTQTHTQIQTECADAASVALIWLLRALCISREVAGHVLSAA